MIKYVSVGVMIAILQMSAFAVTKKDTPPKLSAVYDYNQIINANTLMMMVNNSGGIGRDISNIFGYDYGTWFPFPGDTALLSDIAYGNKSPLYSAGIWIAGKVGDSHRVSVSEYSTDFVPGPYNGDSTDSLLFRSYKLYEDSLGTNPNADYNNWPISDGAPVTGANTPRITGDQTVWSVYNDNRTGTGSIYSTPPLNIEIHQKVWADNTSGLADAIDNSVFVEYKLKNTSGTQIDSFFVGFWIDPDIGNYADDFIGCDSTEDYFFSYNADNSDTYYGSNPPVIGIKVIHGFVVDSPGDSAFFDGSYLQNKKNSGLNAFVHLAQGASPDNAQEVFYLLNGKTVLGADYIFNSNPTKYWYSGNPVTGAGDIDFSPDDRVALGSVGPVTLPAGDSQYVAFRITCAGGSSNLLNLSILKTYMQYPASIPLDVVQTQDLPLPEVYHLAQNYPNPFNPTTTIDFSIPTRSNVSLEIFNILGQSIKVLVNSSLGAGEYSVNWDGTNEANSTIPSGIYFYRLKTDSFVETKRMILLK